MVHQRSPLLTVTKLLVAVLLVLLVAGAFVGCDNLFGSSNNNSAPPLASVPASWNGSYALEDAPTFAVMEIADGTITMGGTQAFPIPDGEAYTHHYSETVCRAELAGEDYVRYTRDADTGHIEHWVTGGSTFTYVPVESNGGDPGPGYLGMQFTLPGGAINEEIGDALPTHSDELTAGVYSSDDSSPQDSAPVTDTQMPEFQIPEASDTTSVSGHFPEITVTPAGAEFAAFEVRLHVDPGESDGYDDAAGDLMRVSEDEDHEIDWWFMDRDVVLNGQFSDGGGRTISFNEVSLTHGWNRMVFVFGEGTITVTTGAEPADAVWIYEMDEEGGADL